VPELSLLKYAARQLVVAAFTDSLNNLAQSLKQYRARTCGLGNRCPGVFVLFVLSLAVFPSEPYFVSCNGDLTFVRRPKSVCDTVRARDYLLECHHG
jgi:hypothetical protein